MRSSCSYALILGALITVLSVVSVDAASFRPIGITNGLGAKVVPDLMVDRDGFLWVASREGLYRYDGYRAVSFVPDENDPRSITDIDLRALYQDSEGAIWVATNTGGLNRLDPETGDFAHFRHDSTDPTSLSDDSVYGMSEGPGGDLWVGTQIGLNRFDPASGAFARFLHDPAEPSSLSNDYVFTLMLDRNGDLWVATVGGGLNRWQPETGGFERFDLARLTGGPAGLNDVFAIVEDGDGSLWVGTRVGLISIDPNRRLFARHHLLTIGGEEPLVTSMVRSSTGELLMGTLAYGLITFDPRSDAVRVTPESGLPPAVPIMSIAESDGLLFIGTWGEGVYLGGGPGSPFTLFDTEDTKGGLRYRNVTEVMATSEPGRPFIGSFGGGVQRLDVTAGTAASLPGETPDLSVAGVLALAVTHDRRMLAGSTDGLWELQADGRPIRFYHHDAEDPRSLGEGYVTSLLSTARGTWVGVGGSGLYFLEQGAFQFSAYRHEPDSDTSLSGNYVTALLDEPGGSLWVGTRSSGLNLCRKSEWSCLRFPVDPKSEMGLSNHHVTTLFRDSRNRVWIGTDGGGLHQALTDEGRGVVSFRRWSVAEGLLSDTVMSVVEDDDGSLWVATREGLTRLRPDDAAHASSVPMTSLPVESFNSGAADRDAGFLYFGAVNGLLVAPAGTPFEPGTPAPVRFTSVELPGTTERKGLSVSQSPALTTEWGEVTQIGFAVLDFAEAPHHYEYRLRPTAKWVDLGSRHDLTFAGLSPGRHELQVRGRGANGLWAEAPPLTIEVVPPFWMTRWFRLTAAAALMLAALAIHRWRTSALERRNLELTRLKDQRERALDEVSRSEEDLKQAYRGLSRLAQQLETVEEEERRRISHELHDELGQALTAAKINLQLLSRQTEDSETGERLRGAVALVDDMIGQVRAIALRLRPPLLDEAGLEPSLKLHLDDLSKQAGIPIDLETRADLGGISPDAELVLFRVVQEAVGNSLRHADPGRIGVTLEPLGDDQVTVRVSDDGRGFDVAEVRRRASRGDHLGLLGMQERLRSVGGSLQLDSTPGGGTRVEGTVPRWPLPSGP